jgi:hypothetical protein
MGDQFTIGGSDSLISLTGASNLIIFCCVCRCDCLNGTYTVKTFSFNTKISRSLGKSRKNSQMEVLQWMFLFGNHVLKEACSLLLLQLLPLLMKVHHAVALALLTLLEMV